MTDHNIADAMPFSRLMGVHVEEATPQRIRGRRAIAACEGRERVGREHPREVRAEHAVVVELVAERGRGLVKGHGARRVSRRRPRAPTSSTLRSTTSPHDSARSPTTARRSTTCPNAPGS